MPFCIVTQTVISRLISCGLRPITLGFYSVSRPGPILSVLVLFFESLFTLRSLLCSSNQGTASACHISSLASVNGFRGIRARQNKIQDPNIQSRDTSPADRSLRFQAMIGNGLMARDTLLCTAVNTMRHSRYLVTSIISGHIWTISRS